MVILTQGNLKVQVNELDNGKRQIIFPSINITQKVANKTWSTSYPLDLIEAILKIKGPDLIEDIQREENKDALERKLKINLFSLIPPRSFKNRRILDYGCGSGTSSLVLARLFPNSEILGLDMAKSYLDVAEQKRKYYNLANCRFRLTSSITLPLDLGVFDFIILSAVYEHLLPEERKSLLIQLWSLLRPGGILFIFDTPNRYIPWEIHTTGLPLINYLPNRIAWIIARRWSKRVDPKLSWEFLLRCGIRGASPREILQILRKKFHSEVIHLKPSRRGLSDEIDLWYEDSRSQFQSNFTRIIGTLLKGLMKCIYNFSRISLGYNISISIKKHEI